MKKEPKNKIENNKTKNIAPKKLKLLITVVNRKKADYYVDLLQDFETNMQLVTYGRGTANSEMLNMLGLADAEKAVIFSIIKDENIKKILETLEEKFATIRDGKGIAYSVSLNSVIGVAIYQFLANNRPLIVKEEK